MRKINFARAHEILSEKEMKNVLGGSTYHNPCNPNATQCFGACMTSNGLGGVCRTVRSVYNMCGCMQL